jgi:hypothetical protein
VLAVVPELHAVSTGKTITEVAKKPLITVL